MQILGLMVWAIGLGGAVVNMIKTISNKFRDSNVEIVAMWIFIGVMWIGSSIMKFAK